MPNSPRMKRSCDGVGHAQLFRHKAGQNVDLIAGGGGDQQVRLIYLRLLLHLVACSVAANSHHIIDVDDIFNKLRLLIDNRDPVLPNQLSSQTAANLARAHNDDLHCFSPLAAFRRSFKKSLRDADIRPRNPFPVNVRQPRLRRFRRGRGIDARKIPQPPQNFLRGQPFL